MSVTTPTNVPAVSDPRQIRLELWWRNLRNFLGELRRQPIALLGGIVVLVFILAALF